MVKVQLTDVSLRDGNQSLWGATGLRTEHILQIAPVLNRVGFRALDFMSSTAMGVAVRTHREDPWQRIRLTRAAMPDTHLQFIGTGLRFISWERAHPDVLRLVYERLVAAGISRFVVLDPTHDMDAVRQSARMIRQAGGTEIIMALTYTISAVHDDAFYAGIAGQAAASPYIDRAYIKDPAGLLTPERARTLIPAVRARLGGKPLELHAHCTIGLSPLVYLTAPDLGVEVLQTGCGALADGSSLPDAERVVANLRELGHTVDVDDRLLARAARYFDRLAAAESLPSGQPRPYDAAFTRHQLAGGVLTTLRRQLAELGLEARFGAVMEEVSRVRAELGYPIMVTPFPQMVMGQALSNVLGGSRYEVVPDQVIRYVLGSFGKPTAPVEPWVLDRILDRPRARELAAEPPPLSVAELRRRLPRGISDEELLLRFAMPAGEVDAMLAAAPAARHYTPEVQPVLRLLRELGTRPPVARLVVDKPGFRLSLRGSSGDSGGLPVHSELVRDRLAAARGFVFDMDGTLVLGDRHNHRLRPLPGALEITSWAARRGLPFVVFTNGTTRTPAHYARTMRDIGFGLPDEAMLTPASSAVRVFVRAGYQRVMVLGGPALAEPLRQAGLQVVPPWAGTAADAVLVGWFPEFTMPALEAACHAVWGGAELYSCSQTPFFAVDGGRALGTSRAISAMIRSLTGCGLRVVGKPSIDALRSAADRLGVPTAQLAVVGDDPQLEVPMAHRGRSLAIAVGTGLGGSACYDGLPVSRRPHLRVRGVDELLAILAEGSEWGT